MRATCGGFGTSNEEERDRLVTLLGDVGVPVAATSVSDQRHTLEIDVAPADAPKAAAAVLRRRFPEQLLVLSGRAQSMWRIGDSQVLTLDGPATHRRATALASRAVVADCSGCSARTPADWDAVELPTRMWWAYSVVRPIRFVAERLGLRSSDHSALEPFLVTPRSLIAPLLDVASVGADDVVFDFGSGDGRFVVHCSDRTGLSFDRRRTVARTLRGRRRTCRSCRRR